MALQLGSRGDCTMIPAAFEYHSPGSIGEATALLARPGRRRQGAVGRPEPHPVDEAPAVQSTAHVVDINGIPGLDGVREADGFLADRRAHARVGSGGVRRSCGRAIPRSTTRAKVIAGSAGAESGHRGRQPRPRRSGQRSSGDDRWRSAPRSSPVGTKGERTMPIAHLLHRVRSRRRSGPTRSSWRSGSRLRPRAAAAPT